MLGKENPPCSRRRIPDHELPGWLPDDGNWCETPPGDLYPRGTHTARVPIRVEFVSTVICGDRSPLHNNGGSIPKYADDMTSLDNQLIESPGDPELDSLCCQLGGLSKESSDAWPARQLELVGKAGIYRWFIPKIYGGAGWNNADIASGYVRLSAACLTTTFIITQRAAAIRRVCASSNEGLKKQLLPGFLTGGGCATIGISHLTTSRQHVDKPVLRATETETGFLIDGFSPWVTGASGATYLVMGAQLENHQQILFAVPTHTDGITIEPGFELVSLSGSQTGPRQMRQGFDQS